MSKKVKVLYFTSNYLPNMGGVEIDLHNILLSLNKSSSIEVRLLVPFSKYRLKLKTEYKKYLIPKNRFLYDYYWTSFSLSFIYHFWKFDIIQCSSCSYEAYNSLIWRNKKKLNKIKIVARTSGSDINYIDEISYGQMVDPNLKDKVEYILEKLDAIICPSELMRYQTLNLNNNINDKIYIIPNGCNIDKNIFESLSKDECKRELSLNKEDVLITHITRASKIKNTELFLDITDKFKEKENYKFLIIGDLENDVKKRINDNKYDNLICVNGINRFYNSNENELKFLKLLKATDIGVFTSYLESFGIAPSELAILGIPIILNKFYGVSSLISNHFKKYVLNEHDSDYYVNAIQELLNNKNEYKSYSEYLKSSFKYIEYDYLSKDFEKLYSNLVSDG